jgi:hypothetical protein
VASADGCWAASAWRGLALPGWTCDRVGSSACRMSYGLQPRRNCWSGCDLDPLGGFSPDGERVGNGDEVTMK